jgi:murein DD-endopeptidase MepM/ murein hydrolase activator NlpD
VGGLGGRARAWRGLALGLAVLWGCASPPEPESEAGVAVHVVRPGENLYRISRHYGVDVASLARANGIRDVRSLQIGQRLLIPGASRGQPGRALAPSSGGRPPPGPGARELALREANLRFDWPLAGRLSSGFGWRGGRRHEGLDLSARRGTAVRAAEAGRVIHSGRLGDYGNVVIVKHAGHFSTVYAHNDRNHVRKGQFVERGDVIASVGRTGNASGTHLHFELRRDRIAQDPLAYLPNAAFAARRD